ncbi:MAG: primosomal protein N' [Ignavibacterium sp.]|jgi:primosomal protein N' (replication factor Y)|nr:primosomal protein N' [Ignavibacterium sp.]MDX9712400.1 primosomal protein N' [Ignavibacteriaceae bacterium]MEB2355506.1 primosomal protein N' [Ignavibacteriales bacterium]GIK21902.1 MAG: primosomal protein N' [Ignavibacteriota bacterium]
MFVEVVFQMPFRKAFTYSVPKELEEFVKVGVRAVAPFGKRTLTGFIINIPDSISLKRDEVKPITDVLDDRAIFTKKSIKFYEWLAEYYLCSLGEALKLLVPQGTDVESKKKIVVDKEFVNELLLKEKRKDSVNFKLLLELSQKNEISFTSLQKAVKKKNIYSQIRKLHNQGAVTIVDEIKEAAVKIKKVKYVKLAKSIAEIYSSFPELDRNSPKQVKILLKLIEAKDIAFPAAELLHKTESSQSSLNGLEQKGLVKIFEKEVDRRFKEHYEEKHQQLILTEDQQEVVDEVSGSLTEDEFKTYLLHGVTGSGKTQVYIELAKKVLGKNKSVLILVPEISLTPQITSRFFNNFGETVTVIHSRMSAGERYDSWRRVLNGKSKVVIGARSALFAPLDKIGLIVVDEEHDASYKSFEMTPKYNARDSAVMLGSIFKCPVVLGSATPSIESMYNAEIGKYKLLSLPKRIDDVKLPKIIFVNIAHEKNKSKTETVFSKVLLDKIEDRLKKKEGIIILQNRRGFSTQIFCSDCGEVEMCENCSVPMVYHINQNKIQCHYCGLIKPVPGACTHCGSINIKYFGTGTERVEDELQFYFPNAKVERIDSDSITKKAYLSNLLLSFSKGEIDILVGTQMVSKGLDFARVTLVGVISAETTLWLPDFRADERTFQLLTQVSGRAGRSKAEGEVIIQTYNERNFVLKKVFENDYSGFYAKEKADREKMGYPPFTRIALIESKDKDINKAKGAITDFYKEIIKFKKLLKISDPTTAQIFKLMNNYRYHILIKSFKDKDPGGSVLRRAILDSWTEFNKKSRFRDVNLFYDVDPQSIM